MKPEAGEKISGYVKTPKTPQGRKGADYLTDHEGNKLPWVSGRIVKKFRNEHGDVSHAMIFEYGGRDADLDEPLYLSGFALHDGGDLFRGEVSGTDFDEAERQAVAESEYWLEIDARDEEEQDAELDEEFEENPNESACTCGGIKPGEQHSPHCGTRRRKKNPEDKYTKFQFGPEVWVFIRYRDRGDYEGHIVVWPSYLGPKPRGRLPLNKAFRWDFDDLRAPEYGFKEGKKGYDSREALKKMAETAISFGSYYTSDNRGDAPDWAPEPEVADAIAEATMGYVENPSQPCAGGCGKRLDSEKDRVVLVKGKVYCTSCGMKKNPSSRTSEFNIPELTVPEAPMKMRELVRMPRGTKPPPSCADCRGGRRCGRHGGAR